MKLQLQLLLLGCLLFSGCSSVASDSYWRDMQSDLGLQVGNPAIAESEPPPSPYLQELQPYNSASMVTPEVAAQLLNGWYAKGQSQQAMRSLLGYPKWVSETQEVYPIGTGDGIAEPPKLIITYGPDPNNPNGSVATGWYQDRGGR